MTPPASTGRGKAEKGAEAERHAAKYLEELLDRPVKRVRSGREGDQGDLWWRGSPFHLDVKHQDRWRLQLWWAELEAELAESPDPDLKPLLILRRPRIVDPARWLAVAPLGDLSHHLVTLTEENPNP